METKSKDRLRILVVDDTPELLELTVSILRKADYDILTATNGSECMMILLHTIPDIILLDVILPDGNDLCKKIKNDPSFSSVYIILLSSFRTSSDTVSGYLEYGADGYISRPVDSLELLSGIEAAGRIIRAEELLKQRTDDLLKELEDRRIAGINLQKAHRQLEGSKLVTVKLLEDLKAEVEQRRQKEEEVQKLNTDLEHRVIERTSQLEAVNSELQTFTYSVSHDLRAPLRAIDGFSKFVLEDFGAELNPEGKRLLGLIRSNAQKMDQLITDLLALSRVSRGELNLSDIDMTKMAVSMLNEAASPEIQKKISIIVEPLPEAYADPTFIKQVWINLISNAIKFTYGKKKPEIKIGGYKEKGFHVYFVKDNGAGFNPEYTHKLFGAFQRLHKTDYFEGTGIGLAIVHRIILRHGGKVWAEGEEGKGAKFYFSLPVKD
jgi:signal transduction histidine kinase